MTRADRGILGPGLLALALACGPAPTAVPSDPEIGADLVGTNALTHPSLGNVSSTPVSSRPYGIAVSGGNLIYVTQIGGSSVVQARLPSITFGSPITTGIVPAHVAFDPAGTRAHVVFNPAGDRAYVTNQTSQTVSVVKVATNQQIGSIPLGHDAFNLLVSPDGKRLYATVDVGTVYAINTSTLAIVDSFSAGPVANGLAFSPDGGRLYVSSRDAGQVVIYNTATGDAVDTLVMGGMPQRLAVSADGNELYIANEILGLDFWDLNAGTRITTLPIDAYGLALSPDNAQIYVTDPQGGFLHIIDRATRQAGHPTLIVGGKPRNIAFNRFGTEALISNEAGYVTVVR